MAEQKKNVHAGHRARLLETIYKVGIENVHPVQALEYILTYVFPRGDMNPLSHALLDKFGNISNVLNAHVNDLKTVSGIGDRAAKRISLLPDIFSLYANTSLDDREDLSNYANLCDFCEQSLRWKPTEQLYILGLDASFHLIAKEIFMQGEFSAVSIQPKKVGNFIGSYNAAHIVLVHNHPGGKCIPSDQDYIGTENFKLMVTLFGCNFIDHLIVGMDGIFSIGKKSLIREYQKICT